MLYGMMACMNKQVCPFCKNDNDCKVDDTACWCAATDISAQLIALLPSQLKDDSCICFACVNAFNRDPTAFKILYADINY